MSPEVLEGATEFTAFAFRQIDVYAAALVIWEILSRTVLKEGGLIVILRILWICTYILNKETSAYMVYC